jgi:hypothetical protein
MTTHALPPIEIGFQLFTAEGGDAFGAVRTVLPAGRPELVIYVEGAGDFTIDLDAVTAVHDKKVLVNPLKLEPKLRSAIKHAHDRELPGL